ncbi:glycosyltransferase [Rhodococcus fascians]|nr:glycosyltransferase [Rhodococcus fascians]MBY4138174.1 glycosyltransferase [Rhodococcus fascians]MBY4216119.1 glycosyltransferase [Rhodococcus fascians]MBY4220650.1 glycosyltransferase [Rhodococcus fascians]MBY4230809.1 glycosyltransferase [Rhodococcus fascians]
MRFKGDSGRPAIIISAFAANPDMSSETGIGWLFIKVASEIADKSDSSVYAFMNMRSAIRVQTELDRLGISSVIPMGIGMPKALAFLERNPQLTRLEYLVWCTLARREMKKLSKLCDIFLAQHVTFATEMLPTPITALPPSAYRVWGPVGASGNSSVYDIEPISKLSKNERRLQLIRDRLALRAGRSFSNNVDLVLAQNDSVKELFSGFGKAVMTFPNVVIKDELQNEINELPLSGPRATGGRGLRLIAVGHLIPRKRFEIAISAMQDARMEGCTLTILGSPLPGTESYLPELVSELGLADRVIFAGKLPRPDVLKHMNESDVLVHPSAREGASGVVGEATAVGIPVVCFDKTGASSVLDASGASGRTVAAESCNASAFVDAVIDASKLPRIRSTVWTEGRFKSLLEDLFAEAVGRRRHV